MIKTLSFILSFFVLQSLAIGAIDTVQVKDLSDEWVYYDSWEGVYMPLVENGIFQGNTIHFECEKKEFLDYYLRVISPGEVTVFINNRLIYGISNDTLFMSVNEIKRKVGYPATITLYAPNIVPSTISTDIVRLSNESLDQLADVPLTFKREVSSFPDFFTTAIILLLACAAVLYNYFPRVFAEFFKASKAFSFRETDENLLKSKPVSQINLFFYLFFSLLAALVILSLTHLGQFTSSSSGLFFFESYSNGIWEWFKLMLIIFVWLVVKFILVSNTSWLFQLGGFVNNHFYNYIRINFIMLIGVLLAIVIFYFTYETPNTSHYRSVFFFGYALMGLQVVMVSLKLLTVSSFKKVHLFSYLCTTELVPFGILLSLGLNQPY
ncbi:DUF4271 domain-containing protein [Fulvivirga sp. M361]|uniref:DUF4271 domain-containing protein n=1 Tax=Fulvivirga sp. M361 TaxID=2594266 RepID=UPI001179AE36|nr:DUF4271 domain-containing protein [Fulvivirga sp. M361]TRX53655.1 DUF4271 domain-containing protein [Fulvivirga sp. M361]